MKTFWIVINLLLLGALNVSWLFGFTDVFGVLLTLIIILSFPLNLLVGWLFFAFDLANNFSATMLFMGYVMCGVGYVQWFKLVPEIAKFFSQKFAKHDLAVNVSLTRPHFAEPHQIAQPPWPSIQFEEQRHSPIDRVLNDER
jgi:hypothetical protein